MAFFPSLLRPVLVCLTLIGLPHALAFAQSPDPLRDVTLQLKWKNQFQFAGYYVAKAKGFYEQAGLNVTIQEAVAGHEPMNEVVEGRADFGVGTTDLLLMHDQGVPVVVLAAIFQHSPLAMMVKESSDIYNVHQLADKTLMIEPHSAELWAYFTKEGMDSEDIKHVEHTFDVNTLLSDEVSGMSVYVTDEPFVMEQNKIEYSLLRPIASGIDFYGDNLFTLESTIENHPQSVDAFVAATRRGWRYAFDNIDETVDLILRDYPTVKTREHLMYEARRTKSLVLSDIVEVGYMNPARWERISQTYLDLGLISKNVALDDFLYNPEPTPIPAWVWRLVAFAVVVAVFGVAFTIYVGRLNRNLRFKEQQLIESNQHKEVLLSIIGHDLKNPIYAIRNYGDMLVNKADDIDRDQLTQYGQMISFGIDTTMGVLDNLQHWAVLQSPTLDRTSVPVELSPIIDRNMELFRLQAECEDISMTATGFENTVVMGNEWRIDAVVRNILTNAHKCTPHGGAITLQAIQDAHHLSIVVEDTGQGMSETALAAFRDQPDHGQIHMTENGSGFGLPLCKQLLVINAGELFLDNRPAGGLRATIRLPKG